jgi:DNA-binding response OmpR family regulator
MPLGPEPASTRILVVDDDGIIAFHLAQGLRKEGFAVVGPAPSAAKALALIKQEGCDFAVLDIHLGQGTAEPIARELAARGVPYAFATGYLHEQLPAIFQDVPLFTKPISIKGLVAEMRRRLTSYRSPE